MEKRGDEWVINITVSAESITQLKKRQAQVNRFLAKQAKEKEKSRRAPGEGSLYQRSEDGMWVGRVELEADANGERRRSKPIYSMDHATAVKKLEKLKADLSRGLDQVDARQTVKDWMTEWLRDIAPRKVRPHVLDSYRSAVNTRIIPAIGSRKLALLKAKDIRDMHDWILSHTYQRGNKRVPYSTRSAEEAHTVLSSALADALEEGHVHRNWCKVVPAPAVVSKSHGELTSEQARSVLLHAKSAGDPLVTRWAAGLMLGGRQGELLGLQWDRVDLEEGSLDLAWQLEWLKLKKNADPDDPQRYQIKPDFEYKPLWRGAALSRPKTPKSTRMTPLPEPLAVILAVYRKLWVPNEWNLVWTNQPVRGPRRPIGDSVDRNGWQAAQKLAQIRKPVDVHAMRGTTATLLMEAGVDAKVIQSILGHSNVVTTRGYQKVNLDFARKALGNLNPLLELD